jgi:hypothetical protein
MARAVAREERAIRPEMTVLDVISRFRRTEAVFRKYDEKAGECICCNALFEPLKNLAAKYDLNLDNLLQEIEASLDKG